MSATRIVIFAKAPQPGIVKTRLIPALGSTGAADLARRMLLATIQSALDANIGPVELCMTPEPSAAAWQSVELPAAIETSDQGAGDLGARLAHAAERAIARGDAVMLIGADCIEMSAVLLREAAGALQQIGTVIHCAVDGGYALLGLTRFDSQLFAGMPWSTSAVAVETQRRIRALGWPLHIGQTLHDIDEPSDLARLPADWRLPLARDA